MNLSKRTSLTALATLCSVAAIGPATASAAKLVTYDVEIDSSTSYNLTQHTEDLNSSWDSLTWFDWTQTGTVHQVRFLDGRLIANEQGEGRAQAQGKVETAQRDHGHTTTGTCSADDTEHDSPPVKVGLADELEGPAQILAVSVADADPTLKWICGDHGTGWLPDFGSKPIDPVWQFGNRPMDDIFEMPTEIVGYGKIIQKIQGPDGLSKGYCPEDYSEGVTKCRFHWSGEAVFKKVSEQQVDLQNPGSIPAATSNGSPTKAPVQTSTLEGPDEELAPLVLPQAKAAVDAKASSVSFTAQCPAGCSGTAALTVPGAGGAKGSAVATAAAKPVARMAFKVKPARKAQRVRIKLSAKARRALKRSGRGSLRVTLKHRGGGGTATSRTLSVRVPRR